MTLFIKIEVEEGQDKSLVVQTVDRAQTPDGHGVVTETVVVRSGESTNVHAYDGRSFHLSEAAQ